MTTRCVAVVLAVISMHSLAACPRQRPARLESVGSAAIDLGRVKVINNALSFELQIRNGGGLPLRLADVQVGCGCMTPSFPRGKDILPGEVVKIAITATVGNERTFRQFALVKSDAPEPFANVAFNLSGSPVRDLTYSPRDIDFHIQGSHEQTQSVFFRSDFEKVVITSVSCPDIGNVAFRQEEENDGRRLYVTVTPLGRPCFYRAIATVETNSLSMPKAPVSIQVRELGLFTWSPRILDLQRLGAGQPPTGQITIRSYDGLLPAIAGVDSAAAQFAVREFSRADDAVSLEVVDIQGTTERASGRSSLRLLMESGASIVIPTRRKD